jgi:hypothetical protein
VIECGATVDPSALAGGGGDASIQRLPELRHNKRAIRTGRPDRMARILVWQGWRFSRTHLVWSRLAGARHCINRSVLQLSLSGRALHSLRYNSIMLSPFQGQDAMQIFPYYGRHAVLAFSRNAKR